MSSTASIEGRGSFLVGVGLLVTAVAMTMTERYSDILKGDENHGLWMSITMVVASFAIFVLMGLIFRETPLPKDPRVKLETPGYDLTVVESPAATGMLLKVLAKIVGNKVFGHLIIRPLMNNNQPVVLRDLARQIAARNIPVLDMPLCRIDNKSVTDAMAKTATDAIKNGLPKSYTSKEITGVMDYHDAYKSGAAKPSEMMHQLFAGMDKLTFMNMFVGCDRERVMDQARESDKRWAEKKPLSVFDGVPIAVKDSITVRGYKKTNGMALRDSDPVQTKDDLMVMRFKEAGAIIVGTTVMTEYGRCPLGYNSHFQGPFNAYDQRRYSGGSSAGSVCSVMTGLVPIAISFDGGGSIRIPAAFSGAFGLAPTFGRVPFDSDGCLTAGTVTAGVNTATTTDTALAFSLLAQVEPGHMITQHYDGGLEGPPRPHISGFEKSDDFSGLKIGIFWDYFNDSDPEICAYCKAVVNELQKRGAKVVEVSIPHLKAISLAHAFNISVLFAAGEEEHFYHRSDLEPATQIQLQLGKTITGVELLSCRRVRGWAVQYIKKLFAEEMDVFITPMCPIVAPQIPKAGLSCGESNLSLFAVVMRYVYLTNLCGFPGMAIPIAYSEKEKLPVSLQIVADHWNEALLLKLSHFIEKNLFQRKAPKHFIKMNLEGKK